MDLQFLGHCYEPNRHDKIWGWVRTTDGGGLSFWGRRGGALAFKRYDSAQECWSQAQIKARKYQAQGPESWSRLLPEDFEGQIMLAILSRG